MVARFRTRVKSAMRNGEQYLTEFTRVMGAHTGPGLVGVAFYAKSQPPARGN